MRRRAGALVAGLVMAGAALLGAVRDDGMKVSPPVTKNGVTCSVRSVKLSTPLIAAENQNFDSSISVWVEVKGDGPFVARNVVLRSVLDQHGKELLSNVATSSTRTEEARQWLNRDLCRMQLDGSPSWSQFNAYGVLKRFPETVLRAQGSVLVLAAQRLVWQEVKAEPGRDAVEIVPGVTVLISQVEHVEQKVRFSYEVRIRRGINGVKAGNEPVFLGLVLRGPKRSIAYRFRGEQEVATRDEYILVHVAEVPEQFLSPETIFEACVADGINEVQLDFEVSNVTLARGATR